MPSGDALTIGGLAKAAGIGVETVRFYERRGLIPEPPRTGSGYRQYAPGMVERLRFIRRAQGLGFTLAEISELLELRVDEVAACGSVEVQAREKLDQVAGKIDELRRIEAALERLVEKCEARKPTGECPILETLDGGGEG